MRYLYVVFALFIGTSLSAQTAFDALRYSTFDVEGTARNTSVGGAMSGIGSDFTALSTNPAGLGGFRFSEWSFTPAVFSTNAKSEYTNATTPNTRDTRKTRFIFPGMGGVSVRTPEQGPWQSFNFGIGYIQLANFNQDFNFSGEARGSIVDRFLDQLRATGFNDYESGLAYDAGAIYDDNSGGYISDIEFNPSAQIARSQSVQRIGSAGELVAGLGGNYNDRLLVGLSVGFPNINYTEIKSYQERDNSSNIPFFETLEFQESLTTTGIGVNAKIGFLFMPTYQLRIGGAIHTPTAYRLEDDFDTSFSYTYTDNGVINSSLEESPDGLFNYKLRSPWRYMANVGYIVGRYGFITGELEYVNQGATYFKNVRDAAQVDIDYLNEISGDINDRFQSVVNLRVGTEFAWSVFRFRGGIGLGTSPYVDEKAWNRKIGLGIGYRKNRFFMDLGYRYAETEESYSPYLIAGDTQPNIQNQFNKQRFIITFGFKQD